MHLGSTTSDVLNNPVWVHGTPGTWVEAGIHLGAFRQGGNSPTPPYYYGWKGEHVVVYSNSFDVSAPMGTPVTVTLEHDTGKKWRITVGNSSLVTGDMFSDPAVLLETGTDSSNTTGYARTSSRQMSLKTMEATWRSGSKSNVYPNIYAVITLLGPVGCAGRVTGYDYHWIRDGANNPTC